ncbi:MAG: lipid-A-disaccharide synthase [Elusimicrobiota bacterium]|jgi:lipid-A-disaccharide synthase
MTDASSKNHFLIVAGDPSADRHGAALVQALRRQRPGVRISALGGDHLKEAADHFIYPLVGLGGFGFWEPLMKLPQLWVALGKIKRLFQEDRPDLVIPMDYYGFNIHVARSAYAKGVPVVYYISPQVWASRSGRIRNLATIIRRMLVILPFEETLYRSAGVPVTFVGHPLLEKVPAPADLPTGQAGPPTGPARIGLLPGSRWGTIQRHLPILVETARRLRERHPEAEFLMFKPAEIDEARYRPDLTGAPWIRLVTDADYRERQTLRVALSVSGTAALENMLLGIPMVILYRLSALSYQVARRIITVPFIGMPNILAGRSIVPELIQEAATPDRLAEAAERFLQEQTLWEQTRNGLMDLRQSLGQGGSERAATAILQEVHP